MDNANVLVLDPYEANELDLDKVSQDKRVISIIHRASLGYVPRTGSISLVV